MKLSYATSIVIAFGLVSQAGADTSVIEEVLRAEEQNSAALAAIEARLDLAQWRLVQLQSLQRSGHATWLEVTRAEVHAKQLRAERQAAIDFATFVAELREAVPQHVAAAEAITSKSDSTAILLRLPGSVRLAAWLEISHLPAAEARKQLALRRQIVADDLAAAAKLLTESEVQAVQKQDFVARLMTIQDRGGSKTELRRAEMQLAAARAEVQLAKMVYQNLNSQWQRLTELDERTPAQSAGSVHTAALIRTGGAQGRFVSHQASAELQRATARLAAAEAEASGGLQAAEILLRRQTLRLEGFEKLRQQGFASPVEFEAAAAQQAAAKQLVERARSHHALLGQAAREFTSLSVAHYDDSAEIEVGELPADFLQHAPPVRHLLDLRQSRLEAAARQSAVAAEREMHEALLEKLTRIGNDSEGGRRELEFAKFDVQFDRARMQAAAERETALRLEERRFALQLAAQTAEDPHHLAAFVEPHDVEIVRVAIAPRKNGPADTQLVPSAYWYDVVNALQSFAGKPLVSERELRTFPPGGPANRSNGWAAADWPWSTFAAEGSKLGDWLSLPTATLAADEPLPLGGPMRAAYIRSPLDAATTLYENPAFADLLGQLPSVDDSPSVFGGVVPASRDSQIHWYRNGIRWIMGVPQVYYPRLRANGYGGPWYIPGSTTNFDRAYNLPWSWRQY